MRKTLFVVGVFLLSCSTVTLAGDRYEDYHGGFGSDLYRGWFSKPERYQPQPEDSRDLFIQKGMGDYDHDGMWDRFDKDADDDGMLNRFDRDPYDSKAW